MQYLLLVIALMAAVVLAARFVPMRGDGLVPGEIQQEMEQAASGDLPDSMPGKPGKAGSSGDTHYRWRGSDGSWHYGDRPPPGVEYESVEPSPTNTLTSEEMRGGRAADEGDDPE